MEFNSSAVSRLPAVAVGLQRYSVHASECPFRSNFFTLFVAHEHEQAHHYIHLTGWERTSSQLAPLPLHFNLHAFMDVLITHVHSSKLGMESLYAPPPVVPQCSEHRLHLHCRDRISHLLHAYKSKCQIQLSQVQIMPFWGMSTWSSFFQCLARKYIIPASTNQNCVL